ncbi:MAG: hypothetical protein QOD72_213, partial [Acidimicrobiaceae bacterium]|nr:hypothetical protein [Acidimicrobiaceae bacterium]
MKRIVEGIAATIAAAVVSVTLLAGVAFAWHPVVAGETTCMSEGAWSVQWTIGNSQTAAGQVMTFDSVTVNGVPLLLSATSVAPGGPSVTGTSAESAATNSATIVVNARWT